MVTAPDKSILTKTIAASPYLRASVYLHLLFNLNLNLFGQATHAATLFLKLLYCLANAAGFKAAAISEGVTNTLPLALAKSSILVNSPKSASFQCHGCPWMACRGAGRL